MVARSGGLLCAPREVGRDLRHAAAAVFRRAKRSLRFRASGRARSCCFLIACGDRAFCMVARSCGSGSRRGSAVFGSREGRGRDLRREAVVVFRRAKRRFRFGASGRAKLLACDCAWSPGGLHVRAKLWFWSPPRSVCWLVARRDVAATPAAQRRFRPWSIRGREFVGFLIARGHRESSDGRAGRMPSLPPRRGAAISAAHRLFWLGARSGVCAWARQGARNCCFLVARGSRAFRMVARSCGSGSRRGSGVFWSRESRSRDLRFGCCV